jgi:lipoprotein-releasing system permease protein
MFSTFERFIAFRYLRSRRRQGFISVNAWFSFLGILLGVATLIIVMAVMAGFREQLLARILGVNAHLTVYGTGGALADFDAVAARARQMPGVLSAIPVIEGQVFATASDRGSAALVRGIRREDLERKPLVGRNIRMGSLEDFQGRDAIMIGNRMRERFGLQIGDPITVYSPRGSDTAFGTMPRLKTYTVVAVFEVGMSEYDNSIMFMPLEAAQLFFQHQNTVSGVELALANPDQSRDLAILVRQTFGTETVRPWDWQDANSTLFNALQVEKNVMFLILTLIILVAAFSEVSMLFMLVNDKSRAIAIMRTMGAGRGAVMRIFFLIGATIGVIGTAIGFVVALAFCLNIEAIRQFLQRLTGTQLFSPEIYFLSQLPAKIVWSDVAWVTVTALILSVLAPIYPAWRAARVDPVEALRYE